MLEHMFADTHASTQNKILQPSAGAMIVVPSACLTKTLTQQLVVYSFALDNRMCSSIRPQITQCQNQKLSLSLSFTLGRRCVVLWQLAGWGVEGRGQRMRVRDRGRQRDIKTYGKMEFVTQRSSCKQSVRQYSIYPLKWSLWIFILQQTDLLDSILQTVQTSCI